MAFDSRIVFYGAPNSDPINYIRAKIYDEATGAQIAVLEQGLDPTQNSFGFSMPVALTSAQGTSATMTLELANHTPDEVVQYSGRVKGIRLVPGDFKQVDIDLYPGPLDNLDVTGIAIAKPIADELAGDSVQATATVTGGNGKSRITWSSLDAKIASVDQASGLIHGLTAGQARIVAAVGRLADTATALVKPRLSKITIAPDSMVIAGVGNSGTFKATVYDGNGAVRDTEPVQWSVENTHVASMGAAGVFQGDSIGSTTVSVSPVSDPSLKATAPLRVSRASVATLSITPADTTVAAVGATVPYHVVAKDAKGNELADMQLAWNSSDTTVARVAAGVATSVNNGTSTISVTADTVTANAKLHVALSAATLQRESGDGQTGVAGAVAAQPIVAKAVDALGQGVAGITVSFATTDGSVSPATATTDAHGDASAAWTFGGAVGAQHATAAVSGLAGSPVQFTATVGAGGSTRLQLVTAPSDSATTRVALARQPVTQLRDKYDNAVLTSGVVVTAKLTTPSPDSLIASTATTDANGRATFDGLTVRGLVGAKTIAFSAPATDTVSAPVHLGAGPAAILTVLSGGNQSGTAGAPVTTVPVVQVTDLDGNPISGVDVTIAIAGGGSVPNTHVTTGTDGKASVGSWTLGPAAGGDTLTLSATNLTPVKATASSRGAAASHLMLTGSNTEVAGVAQTITITALDAHGNVDSTYAGDKTIVFSGPDTALSGVKPTATDKSAAAVAMGANTTVRFTAGAGTASAVLYRAESTQIAATDGAISATGADRLSVTVSASAAARLSIKDGDGQTATAGAAVSAAPRALVTDAYDNPVKDASVTFAVATGGGSATGLTATTDATGIAGVGSWTLGSAQGSNTLRASASGVTASVTFTATASAGSSSSGTSTFAVASTSLAVGDTTTATLTVKDSHGNIVTGTTASDVSLSASVGSLGTVTCSSGVCKALYTAPATTGSATLHGKVGTSDVSGSPVTVTIHAGRASASKSTLTVRANSLAVADTMTVSVTVKDAHDNVISTAAASDVVFTLKGGHLGTVSCTSGVCSALFTAPDTVASDTLHATVSDTNVVNSPAHIAVHAGTAGSIAFSAGSGQSAVVNTSVATPPAAIVKDSHGNPVSGVSVTFAVDNTATGVGSVTGASGTTNASGIVTVGSWTLGTHAGTNKLKAQSTGLTDAVLSATGTAGSATRLAIDQQPTSAKSATAISPAVTVDIEDQYGNLTTSTATVYLSIGTNPSSGTLSGTTSAAAVSGVATLSNLKIDKTGTGYTLVASDASPADGATGLTDVTSSSFNITSGTADLSKSTIAASPTSITANGTATSTITVQLKDASGNNLTASGGTVTLSNSGTGSLSAVTDHADGTYSATLTAPTGVGSAVVTAKLGGSSLTNASNPVTVTFTAGSADLSKSTITASPTSITANGTATSTITVTLKDANGNALTASGGTVTLSNSGTGSLSAVTDHNDGTYSATLTAPTATGSAVITAKLGGSSLTNASNPVTVTFTAGTADLSKSTIAASPTSITANGTSTSTITVQLKDANSNLLTASGGTVVLSNSGTGTLGAVTDHANGTYTATLTAPTTPGSASISGTLGGSAITSGTAAVTFTVGAADLARSTIAASPTSITANGAATSTITVTLKDANGNALTASGGIVTLSNSGTGSLGAVTDHNDGTYTATLTAPSGVGSAVVTAKLDGSSLTNASNPVTVTFTAGTADLSKSTIAASPTSITANGTATSTITVQLKDASGNTLTASGGTVTLSNSGTGSLSAVTDHNDGTYTATLTAPTSVGSAAVTAKLGGSSLTNASNPVTVTFTAGSADLSKSTITASPTSITANGSATSTITVTLKDANGNALTASGGTVALSNSGTGSLGAVTDHANGTYTATLTAPTTPGSASISGTLAGSAITSGAATVTFTVGAADLAKSTVSAAPTSITANGTTTSTITVQLKDANDNDLTASGGTVTMTSTGTGTLGGVTDHNDGTYTATLTSPTAAGSAVVTAKLGGSSLTNASNPVTVTFTAGSADLSKSIIAASPTSITANGTSTSTVTVTLKDANGNALTASGGTVTLINSGTGSLSAVTDHNDGTYTATLTAPTATGSAVITAKLGGSSLTNASNPVTVTFAAGTADLSKSTIAASPTSITANGTSTSAITVTLKDANGNALTASGGTVTLTNSGAGSLSAVTDHNDGTYTATLTAPTSVGSASITAKLGGSSLTNASNPVTVTFATGTADASHTTATVPAGTAGSATTITIQVKDANNNAVTGVAANLAITLTGANAGATLSSITETATPGTYTATYTPTVAGTDNVAIKLSGTAISGSPYSSVVSTSGADASKTTASVPAGTAGSVTTITILAKDANSNPVTGIAANLAITLSGANASATVSSITETATPGTYTATYTPTIAGTDNFAIKLSGTAISSSPLSSVVGAAAASQLMFGQAPTNVVAGATMSPAVTVQIKDQYGNLTASTATVFLTIGTNPGSSTLGGTASHAAVAGVATFNDLTVNRTGTGYTLVASDATPANGATGLADATSTTFNVTAGAGDATKTTATVPSGTAGSATTITITVKDANNNAVSGVAANLAITLTGANAGATVSSITETATPGTYTATYTPTAAGTDDVAIKLSGTAISGSPYSSVVSTGGADASKTTASVPAGTAGSVTTITILAKDASSNPVTGVASSLAITLTGANAGATVSSITETATPGTYTATYTPTATGTDNIAIKLSGTAISSSPLSSVVGAGAATQLVFAQAPSNVAAGATMTPAVTVQIKDHYGNLTASTSTVFLSIGTNPGTSTLSGTLSHAAVSGVATFNDLSLNKTGTGYTLVASDATPANGATGLADATSSGFNVSAGAADATRTTATVPAGTAGAATTITIAVKDANNNPVTGVAANLAITLSGANAGATVSSITETGTAGTYTATYTPTATGTDNVAIKLSGTAISGSPYASIVTAASARASHTTATVPAGTAGAATTVTIVVKDANDNAVTGVAANLAINLTGANAGATVSSITETATPGTYTATYTPTTAGTDNLAITLSGTAISGSPYTSVVSAGSATQIAINGGDAQSATVGTAVATAPSVIVKDAHNNPVSGVSVTFAVATGGGSVTGGAATTNASGIATVGSWTLGTTSGANSMTATSTGLTGSPLTFTATGNAGTATQIVFGQAPTTVVAGATMSPAVTVQIKDQYGNLTASTATVFLTIGTNPGTSTLSGTVSHAAVSGVATFNDLSLNKTGTGYTLVASDASPANGATGLADATSTTFNVTVGTGDATRTAATVPAGTVGTATTITITVKDANDNAVSGVAANLAITLSGANAGATISSITETATPGTYTATYTPATTGTDNLTIKLSGTQISGSPYSSVVSAGATASFSLNAPADIAAGTRAAYTVTRKDSNGNLVTTGARTVFLTATGGAFYDAATNGSTITQVTIADGQSSANFWFTHTAVGSYTVTASDASPADGATGITDATDAIGVNAAAASQLVFGQAPTSVAAGATMSPAVTVQIKDQFGNLTASTASVFLTIGTNPGTATLGGTLSHAAVSGVARFNDLTLNKTGTGYTLVASDASPADGATGLADATSGTFTVNAGTADATKTTATVPAGTAGAATTITIAVKDANNNAVPGVAANLAITLTGTNAGATISGITETATPGTYTATYTPTAAGTDNVTIKLSGASINGSPYTSVVSAGSADATKTTATVPAGTAGATTTVTILVKDANNNAVTGVAANLAITLTGANAGATLSAITETATPGTYTATYTPTVIGTDSFAIKLSGTAISGSPYTSLVSAGAAATLSLNSPADIAAGTRAAYTVTRKDVNTNVVTSGAQTVFLTATGGTFYDAATNGSAITQVTIADGQSAASFWFTHTAVGSYTVTASDASPANGATGIADASDMIGVTAAAASQLVFGQAPTSAQAGAAISPAVTVQIKDQYGNLTASTANVFLTVGTNPGTSTLSGTLSRAAVAGVATFNDLRLNKTGTGYTLVASDASPADGATGLADATSATFNITAGTADAAHTTFAASPASVTVGGTTTLTITVLDANGNPVTTVTPSDLAISETGGPLGSLGTVSCTNGVCTVTYTAGTTSGTATLHAKIGGADVSGSPLSLPVNAGAADHFVVTGSATQVAGAAQTVTVKALDSHNNVATGFTGDQAITFSGASTIGANNPTATDKASAAVAFGTATTLTFTNGQATTSMVLYKAESAVIVATQNSITTSGTDRLGVTVSNANATALSVTTQPAGAVAGTALTTQPVIQLSDAYGNPVAATDSSITATLNVPGGATGSLGGTATVVTNASGVATFTNLVASGTAVSGYTITFTATLNGSARTITSAPFAVAVGGASKLVVTTGPPSTTTSATAITPALVVKVEDAGGNVVTGSSLSITAALDLPGGASGSLGGTVTTAASSGVATFSNLVPTASAVSGYTLTFTGAPVTAATTSAFAITAGAATKLAIITQPSTTANSGQTIAAQPVVEVRDAANNVVQTAGNTVLAVLDVPNGAIGSLIGTATATTASNGRATFSGLAISGQNATTYTLTFHSTIGGTALTTVTSTGIALTAGAANHLSITTQPPTNTTNGSVLSTTPVVQLRDASNNPVASFGTTVTVTSSCGTLSGTASTTTDDGGAAYFDNLILSGTASTSCTLTFASSGLTGITSNSITIAPGAAAVLAQNGTYTTSATVGTSIASKPSVKLTDAGGNAVSGATVTFSIENGGGSITGATQTTNASGIATLGTWTLGTTAGTNSVLASVSAANVSGVPVRFSVTGVAGAASTMTKVAGDNQTATVGTAVATLPSVIVKDANGNVIAGATVTFSVTAGGGSVTGASATTDAFGVATVGSWTLGTTAGTSNQTLHAVSGSLTADFTASTTAGAASALVNATTGGVTSLGNTTVGAAVSTTPTVKVTDSFGNVISGYPVNFSVGTGSGSVTTPTTTSSAAGTATPGTWTIGTSTTSPSSHTLVASATGIGTTITFTATPVAGTATQFVVSPASAVVSSATTSDQVTGTLKDQYGNTVLTTATNNVAWSANTGGTYSATTNGTFTTTLNSSTASGVTTVFFRASTAGTYTLTGTVGSVQGTATVAFGSGVPASVLGSASATTVTSGTVVTLTAQLKDASGGNTFSNRSNNTVSWVPAATETSNTLTTDGRETATFTATGTPGTVISFTPTWSGKQGGAPQSLTGNTFTVTIAAASANPVSFANSTVTPATTSIAANGTSTSLITVQLKDASSVNTTTSGTVTMSASGGTIGAVTNAGGGQYTATFTSNSTAGVGAVTALIDGVPLQQTGSVAKTGSKYAITLTQNGQTLTAGAGIQAGSTVSVRAQLQDGAGNNITNVTGGSLTWSSTNGGSFSNTTTVTNGAATATFTATSSTNAAQVVSVSDARYGSVAASGYPVTGSAVSVTTIAVPSAYVVTSNDYNPAVKGTVTISAQLVDGSSNPIALAGRTVNWLATTNGQLVTTNTDPSLGEFSSLTSTTNASGIATVSFTVANTGDVVHTVRATDATNVANACASAPCTGVSSSILTGVTLVGQPSNTPANAQSTSVSFSYPTGIKSGDLMVVALNLSNSGGGDPSTATVTTAGWTEFEKLDNAAGQLSMRVLYKFATGSETGSLTLGISNNQRVGGSLVVYRNADPTTPLVNAVSTIQTSPQTGTAPFPMNAPQTVTTSRPYSRVVTLFEHSASGSNRVTLPSSVSQLFRYDGSNSSGGQYTVIAGAQSYQNGASTTVPEADATTTAAGMFIATQFVIQHVIVP